MGGVEVSAQGANVVTTGNDGLFVLTFPEGHPGQDVRVRVRRPGWEVVNDILLDHRLPDSASARPNCGHYRGIAAICRRYSARAASAVSVKSVNSPSNPSA